MAQRTLAAAAFLLFAGTAGTAAGTAAMPIGGLTSQPIGHYEFCKKTTEECSPVEAGPPAVMDYTHWQKVKEIHRRVNAAVKARSDSESHGKDEVWSYPGTHGDCEDYALEKRRAIHRETGIGMHNLLITVLRKSDGEGHAVLTIRTTVGDFILDNLKADIPRWDTVKEYSFIKRQAIDHAGKWSSIEPVTDSATASAGH